MIRPFRPWAPAWPAAAVVVAAGLVIGCPADRREADAGTTEAAPSGATAEAAPAAPAAGRPFRLGPPPPARPERVVTLAPSLTETVLALGGRDRLVGVGRFDDAPEVADLPRVGGYVDPNLEAILALRPDLLVVEASPGNEPVVRKLAELGVPVRVTRSRTVTETLATLRAVAEDLGVPERGAALDDGLEARLAAVRAAAQGLPRPRTLLVYGHEPLVVAAPGTFADELLAIAGGENVVPRSGVPYPVVPLERVVAADPEVVVDLVMNPGGAPRPGPLERLDQVAAVRTGRVARITDPALMRPGPRLHEAAAALYRILHPGAEAAARLEAALAAAEGEAGAAPGATAHGSPSTPGPPRL